MKCEIIFNTAATLDMPPTSLAHLMMQVFPQRQFTAFLLFLFTIRILYGLQKQDSNRSHDTKHCFIEVWVTQVGCLNTMPQTLAMAQRLMCLSQVSVLQKWYKSFFRPILHCVIRTFRYLQKQGYFPLKLCPKLRTQKIHHCISIVKTRYQLSLRMMDAHRVINWTVVSQLSWQYLRWSTASLSH